jgi:hypothetical protein
MAVQDLDTSAPRRSKSAIQSETRVDRAADDDFEFPPTAHPGRELLTMILFALSCIALMVWGVFWVVWRLISLI